MCSDVVRAATARSSKAERTAAAIKDAARRVIARDGYVNSRIVDIAQEAGKGIGTFYAYFDSKEALLAALAEDFRVALTERIQPPREAGDHPLGHLQDAVRAFWNTYQRHRAVAVAVFQTAMHDERFAAIWRDIRKDGTRVSTARIRQAQQLGLCPGLDPERAATALCSMIEFACFEWSGGLGGPTVGEDDGETVVATLTRLMTHAIGWREDVTAFPGAATP
jgi:AcrR family transcriptional regulator